MPARIPPLLLASLPAALIASPALAQQHDDQLWLQVNTNVPVTRDVRVTLEQIGRFSDRQDGLYQSEFGALVGWRLSGRIELGVGYRKVGTSNNGTDIAEDRLRQQVIATFGPVTTRLRVDERFHPLGDEVGVRVRPLVRFNHRLTKGGLGLFVSHESFLLPNSTTWGQRSGYERMRNIVGLAFPIGPRIAVDAGYLNQYRFARGGAQARMDHALTLQLTINLRGFVGAGVHD